MKILIAEDDFTSRSLLKALLTKRSHEVVATVNGAEAWEAMRKPDAPHMAILDWMMPQMDGLDVCRNIRSLETDRPPYIIMLTTKGEKVDIVAGLEAGANDYLPKPYDPGELHARIDVGRRLIEMQEELRESENRYKTLAEKSFTGVFVIQDGLFVYITKQAAQYYGYDVAALMSTRPERIVFPEDYEIMRSMAVEMIKGKRTAPYEYRIITNDNAVRWIMETVSPISFNGRPAILGNCIDITERRQREVQDLHSQKLESVGQLAAGIAHEINTPIQFVGDNITFMNGAFQDILSLYALLSAVKSDDLSNPAVVRDILSSINKKEEEIDLDFLKKEIPQAIQQSLDGLQRVSKIVMAMREFSHPGGEGMSDLDINKAIESTIILTHNEWKYWADLTATLAPDLPTVQGYPSDFNQVILNIIVNAAQALQEKAGKTGGTEKGRIAISTRQVGNEAEICIRDTGMGIPPVAQSRVFDPFFTTKDVGKGTGQGLTIAQNIIVQKHRGKIYFETKPGEGTAFYIRLPLETL